ncbi:MAG: MBL fold metallo-hydrolase [Micromonosporaceae bacterium]|nr:MBL fold metallo-hydrolase [Micromonosporaceae bacterium]
MTAATRPGDAGEDYSIRVVRQAVVETTSDFVGGCLRHSNQGMLDIPIVFTLVSLARDGAVQHHVVDCGVGAGPRTGGRPPPRSWISPGRFLTEVGIAPADVQWLLLTHLHKDHSGNLADLPHATVGVQRAEYDGWTDVLGLPASYLPLGEASWAHRAISPDTLHHLREGLRGERTVLLDGDYEITPGLAVRLARDSHTFGSQLVTVDTPEGVYVVGGDNVFAYSNLTEMWPSGAGQGNQFHVLEVLAWVNDTVGGDHRRVVPGHDMAVFAPATTVWVGDTAVAEVRIGSWDRSWGGDRAGTPGGMG